MLTTQRLRLRSFQAEDFADFAALIRDKMSSQWAAYDSQWPVDDASLRDVLMWLSSEDSWYCVELAEEKCVVGYIAAGVSGDGSVCELGYTMHRAYMRRGLACEACAAIMREKAKDGRLKKFTAGTAACNVPSIALLHRLGFEKVAEHIACFANDVDGRPIEFTGCSFECGADVWREEGH